MNKLQKNKYFRYIAITFLIAIFFSIDQFLKLFAWNLKEGQAIKLINNIFSFHFAINPDMAFSIPFRGPLLNGLIVIIIILLLSYIIYLASKKNTLGWELFLWGLILAGALSNISDRLIYGYVVDYLNLKYFTIFNLADIMISVGAAILIFKNLKR